ncbi:ABC transporter substrate-binding protein [Mycoplasmopsis adleri]|uniref:ABC transporter substrate-binding protein n=1 Tax=Mycoplasmopsis adleri TaxID=51362 RepID=UPI0038730619
MKSKKILLGALAISSIASTVALTSCGNTKIHNVKDYDLGLVSEPINSLNYIKFSSVNKILPSLVESPLKSGPSENIKRILSLPELPMGVYQNNNMPIAEYFNNVSASDPQTGTYYPLDQFGTAAGVLSTDSSIYRPVNLVVNNNKVQSMSISLNEGNSKWSNGDEVTADDFIDAVHYILDLTTGSQRLTGMLQRKFDNAQNLVDIQQEYIKEFGITYTNPFQYPSLIQVNGVWMYDGFNPNYKLFPSQIDKIVKSQKFANVKKDDAWKKQIQAKEAEILKRLEYAVRNLGIYSGRLYWNYSNKDILSSIPYSPDFDPNADETIVMLPNPDYMYGKHSMEELANIPQRVATRVKKYLFTDRRQKFSSSFDELLRRSRKLKNKVSVKYSEANKAEYNAAVNAAYNKEDTINNDFVKKFDSRVYRFTRQLAFNEYSIRVEYSPSEPTSLSNAVQDLQSHLIPINRKFVEINGGITEFGLNKNKFLTNGPFNLDEVVLGPQGFVTLLKNPHYYSSDKTLSNKIKILFSSDPNINSALYADKYIAATKIPAIQQLLYWTDINYRKHMKKASGFGTIALAFNLDQERYEKASQNERYIYDENLRCAIYYAIDRNEMLNIVGWNSSYPVITWTAFGQGASSFGDPIELAFDHDYMYPNVSDKVKKPIPIENYTHIDHLSKNYNFEHVDRTDKAHHLDIAREYLEKFKKAHPEAKSVKLRYISNSSDEQQNAGLALQDFMTKAFGGYVDIEIKSLPENVYEDFRTKGQFDLLYRNFDAFGTDAYSYVKVFFRTDGIDTKNAKETGFRNNPSGSWTYADYFAQLGYKMGKDGKVTNDNLAADSPAETTRKRLMIKQKVWDKIVELVFKKPNETNNDFTNRYTSFFTNQFTPEELKENWTEQSAFAIIAGLEKVVRDGAPVVPLMEVDTYWEISRVNGAENLYTYSLQFAYDIANPPKPYLPTEIKED